MKDKLQLDSEKLLSLINSPCMLCEELVSQANSIQICECDGFIHRACIKVFIEHLFKQEGLYAVFCKVCLSELRVSVEPKCKLTLKKANIVLVILALTMLTLCLIKLGRTIYAQQEDNWAMVHIGLLYGFAIVFICVAFIGMMDMCFGKQYRVVEVQKIQNNCNCSIQITVIRKTDNRIQLQSNRDTEIRCSGVALKALVGLTV